MFLNLIVSADTVRLAICRNPQIVTQRMSECNADDPKCEVPAYATLAESDVNIYYLVSLTSASKQQSTQQRRPATQRNYELCRVLKLHHKQIV